MQKAVSSHSLAFAKSCHTLEGVMRLMKSLSIYVAFACISVACPPDAAAQRSKLPLTANNRGAADSYVRRPPLGDNRYNNPPGGFAYGYAWGHGFQRTGNGYRMRGFAYGGAKVTTTINGETQERSSYQESPGNSGLMREPRGQFGFGNPAGMIPGQNPLGHPPGPNEIAAGARKPLSPDKNYTFDEGNRVVRIFHTPRVIRLRIKGKEPRAKEEVYTVRTKEQLKEKHPEVYKTYVRLMQMEPAANEPAQADGAGAAGMGKAPLRLGRKTAGPAPTMNNLINQIEQQTIGVPLMEQVLRDLRGNVPVPPKRP